MGYYLKSFSWSSLTTIDSHLKKKALKKILGLHQDYGIAIPRDRVIWHFAKYALPRRTVQVFLDLCLPRDEIPKYLIRFIEKKVYDKMNPNPFFSLKTVQAA